MSEIIQNYIQQFVSDPRNLHPAHLSEKVRGLFTTGLKAAKVVSNFVQSDHFMPYDPLLNDLNDLARGR